MIKILIPNSNFSTKNNSDQIWSQSDHNLMTISPILPQSDQPHQNLTLSEYNLTNLFTISPQSDHNLTKILPQSDQSEHNVTNVINLTKIWPQSDHIWTQSDQSHHKLTTISQNLTNPQSDGLTTIWPISSISPQSHQSDHNVTNLTNLTNIWPQSDHNLTKLTTIWPQSHKNLITIWPIHSLTASPQSDHSDQSHHNLTKSDQSAQIPFFFFKKYPFQNILSTTKIGQIRGSY